MFRGDQSHESTSTMFLTRTFVLLCLAVCLAHAKYNFKVVQAPKNFEDALAHCKSIDHSLVIVMSPQKNAAVYAQLVKEKLKKIWIGVSRRGGGDTEIPKEWQWNYEGLKRGLIQASFWSPGEPNNFRKRNEQCVEMRNIEKTNATHNWNDFPCNEELPFICETL